ncbi:MULTISPECIES: helix-turn-helix transcriptional regulator [Catenuloplanes]|uniref:DNA-binding NarL/FixJ family response regulator n=1 Tax=Catenuloplanes niger TaxID=587534 RepID=A0AAE3ZKG8_9ACTN|nr:LuxR C-terminal-related transcriptional regulator [Catenuloplanes niger]MDR7320612.1 DNA-binding NarL/FixJ family response regulator [Catenuloplanes niger]
MGDRADAAGEAAHREVRVAIRAPDPLARAGVAALLRHHPGLVPAGPRPDVLVLCCPRLTAQAGAGLRRVAAGAPVVLVVDTAEEEDALVAARCRVVAVLARASVTAEALVHCVLAAADLGGGLPPNLAGELLARIGYLRRDPLFLGRAGLTPQEVRVLRLLADGLGTAEVAARMRCSERTVKTLIHHLNHRLGLRNRPHAVAYALRAGAI